MPPLFSSRLLRRRTSNAFLIRLLRSSSASSPKADVGPLACHLKSRSVVAFSGPDTFKFLQGLLTNDVRRFFGGADDGSSSHHLPTPNVGAGGAPAVYAAMLTPQGRFLYDMVLYRPVKGAERSDRKGDREGPVGFELVADVDAAVVDELLSCLKKYRLRSKVEVENVTKEFSCWQHFGGNLGAGPSSGQDAEAGAIGRGSGVDRVGASSAQGNNHGWRWFKDPRLSCLGFRGIFPAGSIPPMVEADKGIDEKHYLLWRLEKGVAEGSLEIPKGEAIPLEYNFVGLNTISFDKGCYVGQEFVARTHHRGVIRKRLLPLKFTNDLGADAEHMVAPGSEVVDASNKKIGTVSTALGSCGMGVLRLEDAFKSPCLGIKDQHGVKAKPIKPDWWPAEWTHDLEQHSAAV